MQVASRNFVGKWINKYVKLLPAGVVIEMEMFGEFFNHAFLPVLIAILHIIKPRSGVTVRHVGARIVQADSVSDSDSESRRQSAKQE
jgi:hypothetical protein